MTKSFMTGFGLLIGLVLFVTVNIFAGSALHKVRVDLTEDGLYSLSTGSRNILANLDEPITVRYFFSKKVAESSNASSLAAYNRRVRELLEEYAAATDSIELIVIEPEPFSEEEDEAVGYGLTGARINQAGDRMYFGMVATNSVDDESVIPFFDPSNEQLLEYEVTKILSDLATGSKKIVGILSTLPIRGSQASPPGMPPQQPQQPPWAIVSQIEQNFEVRWIGPEGITEIDPEVDVLMLVHPKDLSDATRYAVDQYALKGGKIMAFVDALSNFDPSANQRDPMANRTSNPHDLLSSWGVELVGSRMAGDSEAAQQVPSENGTLFFPLFMGMKGDNMSEDDVATDNLDLVNMFTSGILTTRGDATTTVEPLIRTGTESMQVDTIKMQFQPDLKSIADTFVPSGERLTVAVRITGDIQSAFPDGAPADPNAEEATPDETTTEDGEGEESDEEEGTEGEDEATEPDEPEDTHLAASEATFNAIVVADCDMLYNDLWGRQQRDLFGRVFIRAIADNHTFIINSLENLCGSSDMISLRSRGRYQRPFEKKLELQKEASESFRAREEELQAKLLKTEEQLADLQKERTDTGGQLLSEEQEQMIQRFRDEQVQTRKDLRQVQRDLQQDIDGLGRRLKFFNIAALPLVILLGGLLFSTSRKILR